MSGGGSNTTYRRPSVSIGMGFDGDYSWMTKDQGKDATGFVLEFNLPFKKVDVFAELMSDDGQLGNDGDDGCTYTILRPGREEGKLVSTGCVREAAYGPPIWGRTVSELREIKAPTYIRWSTLMQEGTIFNFVGKDDDNPKVQIALKEMKKNSGCSVTMKFDFLEVGFNGMLCCLSFLAQDILKANMQLQLPAKW